MQPHDTRRLPYFVIVARAHDDVVGVRTDGHAPWAPTSGLPYASQAFARLPPTGATSEGLRIGNRERWIDPIAGQVTVHQRRE
jgi:hypothetical protein